MQNRKPQKIVRLPEEGLQITWSDGNIDTLAAHALRQACPCANCREQRGDGQHDKPLGSPKRTSLRIVEHTIDEQITLESIHAVGSYAVRLRWKDGHDTGIYPFELLDQLSRSEGPNR